MCHTNDFTGQSSPLNASWKTAPPPGVFSPDYREMIGRSDLFFKGIILHGPQGFTVANGRFGGPVWQKSGHSLKMQLNHTDTFMFNDASASSEAHKNSGGGAIGQISISFGKTQVFGPDTEQHLSLYDGQLRITGHDVTVQVTSDMNCDVILLQITDNRPNPTDITIDLIMVREAVQQWGRHSAITSLITEDDTRSVVLEQVFTEACDTGISANDFYCASAIAIAVQGIDVASITDSMVGTRTARRLTLSARNGAFTVVVGGDSSMHKAVGVRSNALDNALTSPGYESTYAETQKWWGDFWSKSYVCLPSLPDYEKRRNYFMYLSAISNRGSYPSKYNGGIWIAEEDRRDWGSFYWNWNQDPQYQPLADANHLELLDPLFKMRETCYERYQTAAKQLWGAEGVFIGETCGILGWETLPEDIADDLRAYYTTTTEPCTQLVSDLGSRRNSYLVPWNWKISVCKDDKRVSWVTHTLVATQETAAYFWQRYCYTKDIDWLRDHAYPFIRGAAELYRTYPGFVKEADGKYHFNRTNLHEHIWAGRDIIDDLSLARGIFAVVVKVSELLEVDRDMRSLWEDCRDNLADYPLRTDPGALCGASRNPALATDKPAWAQGAEPTALLRGMDGTESPIFKMLERFDVLNLETRDQGLDNGDFDIALNTYYYSPGYYNQVVNHKEERSGSSRFHIDAAILGRTDDMEQIFSSQYGVFTTYGEHPNMLYDQGDYYSTEGYGTFTAGIQKALHQSISPTPTMDPVIRVFPAWPRKWDAKFKLLAKDGFVVSSSMESGEIEYIEIVSQLGNVCHIRNPWESAIILYRNRIAAELIAASKNDMLTVPTQKGETLLLVSAGMRCKS